MAKGVWGAVVGLLMCAAAAMGEMVDNGDGTVTDTATKLMWQQAETGSMTWEAALAYCDKLELAGHDDWPLPNRNELQSIVDYEAVNPAIAVEFFPGTRSSGYWSSTTYADNTIHAWHVNFNYGNVNGESGIYGKSVGYHVRAVRGGQ